MHLKESMTFLKRFASSPRRIGSVAPSSKFLVRAMLDRVNWEQANFIAELGAGTGVFTREIVKRAKPNAKILKGLTLHSDAQELENYMHDNGINELDYVISSLPFTVLPPKMTVRILNAVRHALKPEGHLIAYQYSSIMRHVLQKKFSSIKTRFVLRNIPPAFVYDCMM